MQINTKSLLKELEWAKRFIEKKNTIPILSHALFQVENNRLTLTGTNLETAGITTIEGNGRGVWSIAVPIEKLVKYLGKVDDPEVTLSAGENHWLTVQHGSDSTRVAGMSRESYPEVPAFPAPEVTLGRFPLAVERVAFAIAAEESRFTLNGALLEMENGHGKMVATDGHRISLAAFIATGTVGLRNLILSKFALLEAAKLEDGATLATNDDHAFLSWGGRRIVTRKLTGNFPDWRVVMTEEFAGHAMLPTRTLLKTLDRVALYADERSHAVRFTITDGVALKIAAQSVEEGQADGVVPIKLAEMDNPIEAGYNASYIIEFLRQTDAQFVAFCWQKDDEEGPVKPTTGGQKMAVFTSGTGWSYGVMPMRI